MVILNQNTTICRSLTITGDPNKDVANREILLSVPADLAIATVSGLDATLSGSTITVPLIEKGTVGLIVVCFTATVDNPTSTMIPVEIVNPDSNLADNVTTITLEYTTCGDIAGCTPPQTDKLCTTDGDIVLVSVDYQDNITFKNTDGTDFTGDVNALVDCSCLKVPEAIPVNSGNNVVVTGGTGPLDPHVVNGYGVAINQATGEFIISTPAGDVSSTPICDVIAAVCPGVSNIAYDPATGDWTISYEGTRPDDTFNTGVENFLQNASYDDATNILTLTLVNGTSFPIDLTDLVDIGAISVVTPVDHSNTTPFGETAVQTHEDGNGNSQTTNTPVTGFNDSPSTITIDPDRQQVFYNELGQEFCVPKCNNRVPTAGTLTDDMVGCTYYGTVAGVVGGDCLNPQVNLIESTVPAGVEVVMGAAGEFRVISENCEDGDMISFNFQNICENGNVANGTVNLTVALPAPPAAQDDFNVGFIGGLPVTGTVVGNDTPCDPSCDTEWVVVTPGTLGTFSFGTNGGYIYTHANTTTASSVGPTGDPGLDRIEYEIKCCGVLTGVRAFVYIQLFDAMPADDSDIVPANNGIDPYTPITLSATDDDVPAVCPGGTIVKRWLTDQAAGLTTYTGPVDAAFGIIDGTPDSFTYVPNPGSSNVGVLRYEVLCDVGGVLTSLGEATHLLYVSAGLAMPDATEGNLDETVTFFASANDFLCSNGGVTNWEFFTPTIPTITAGDLVGSFDGGAVTGLLLDGDATTGIALVAFDNATGSYTLTPFGGYGSDGTCLDDDKLEHRLICTTPNGTFISE